MTKPSTKAGLREEIKKYLWEQRGFRETKATQEMVVNAGVDLIMEAFDQTVQELIGEDEEIQVAGKTQVPRFNIVNESNKRKHIRNQLRVSQRKKQKELLK